MSTTIELLLFSILIFVIGFWVGYLSREGKIDKLQYEIDNLRDKLDTKRWLKEFEKGGYNIG